MPTASRRAVIRDAAARARRAIEPNGRTESTALEYLSAKHPEWPDLEWEYAARHAKKGLPDKHPDAVGPAFPGDTAGEKQLDDYVESLQDPARRDEAILELLDRVGPEAMRPPVPGAAGVVTQVDPETGRTRVVATYDGPSDPIERLHDFIRGAVWQRINEAYRTAREPGPVEKRGAAQQFLKDVGNALAGDGRGRRTGTDVLAVRNFYWRYLFRLERALALLRTMGKGGGWWPVGERAKIEFAFEACALSWEEFRDYVRFDDAYVQFDTPRREGVESHVERRVERPSRWLRPKWRRLAARELTARTFGISEIQVRNLLARSGFRLSAK